MRLHAATMRVILPLVLIYWIQKVHFRAAAWAAARVSNKAAGLSLVLVLNEHVTSSTLSHLAQHLPQEHQAYWRALPFTIQVFLAAVHATTGGDKPAVSIVL